MQQPDLRHTQEILWQLIAAPEGVTAGLAALPVNTLPNNQLESVVLPNQRMTASERLDIYANMYFFRIRDAIAEDFPGVVSTIGFVRFHNLITEYLTAHPSTSWTLADAAGRLADFVKRHPLQQEFPFLTDLIQFEWALCEAFFARDALPLQRNTLTALEPQTWPALLFSPVPSLRLVPVGFDVRTTHEAADKTKKDTTDLRSAPISHRSTVLVWRRGPEVFHRYCHVHEALVLDCFRRGKNFADTCETLATSGEAPPDPITELAKMLAVFVEEELLTMNHCSQM